MAFTVFAISELNLFVFFLRLIGENLCGLGDAEAALYMELWRACAGPLVTVPREQDLVFYFPQGHIEQVCVHVFKTFISVRFVTFLFSSLNTCSNFASTLICTYCFLNLFYVSIF